jgi:hypothetical protein
MRALKWRALVAVLCSAAWPLAAAMPAAAQQAGKIARVGVLSPADSDKTPAAVAFQTLQELGYVEGTRFPLGQRSQRAPGRPCGGVGANPGRCDRRRRNNRCARRGGHYAQHSDHSGRGRRSGQRGSGGEPRATGRQRHGIHYSHRRAERQAVGIAEAGVSEHLPRDRHARPDKCRNPAPAPRHRGRPRPSE